MPTTRPARPGRPRAVRGDGPLADLRPALAHRPAPARPPGTSTTSWATTTTPSSPTPRGCRPTWSPPSSTPRAASATWPSYLDRIDNTVQYSWLLEIARTFLGFTTTGSPRRRSTTCTTGPTTRRDGAGLGPQVWDEDQPRGGLPDQRLRRPARRLRHARVRPLPADRRPGLQAPRAADARAAAAGDRTSTSRTTPTLRQAIGALFEHFVGTGRGPAPSPCRPTSPRRGRRPSGPSTPDPPGPAPDGPPARRARRDPPARLLDAGRVLRRVPPAVRPDDRRDPQRLPGRRHQGPDLFDRRVSLHQYRELFNHFPGVTFPVSTLSPDARTELVAYAWIFPNVVPQRPLVVLEHPGVHRRRPAGAAPGGAEDEADRLLLRHVQAGVRAAEVQHVPADPGRDAGRGRDPGRGWSTERALEVASWSSWRTRGGSSRGPTPSAARRFDRARNARDNLSEASGSSGRGRRGRFPPSRSRRAPPNRKDRHPSRVLAAGNRPRPCASCLALLVPAPSAWPRHRQRPGPLVGERRGDRPGTSSSIQRTRRALSPAAGRDRPRGGVRRALGSSAAQRLGRRICGLAPG